jgi:hypothetical protein
MDIRRDKDGRRILTETKMRKSMKNILNDRIINILSISDPLTSLLIYPYPRKCCDARRSSTMDLEPLDLNKLKTLDIFF